MKRLFALENILSLLLIFVPIALMLQYVAHASGLAVFITSAISTQARSSNANTGAGVSAAPSGLDEPVDCQ